MPGGTAGTIFGAGLPLLAGYLFIRLSYLHRYQAEFLRTEHYAAHILLLAVVFYAAGAVVAGIPNLPKVMPALRAAGLTAPLINSVAIAALVAVVANLWNWVRAGLPRARKGQGWREPFRQAALELFMCKSSDAARRLLFRANLLQKLVMVTLKSQRVYVGQPQIPDFDPRNVLTSVRLVPFASGQRHPTTRKVEFRTSYEFADKLGEPQEGDTPRRSDADPLRTDRWSLGLDPDVTIDLEDFGIIIPWAEVESATIFDQAIYAEFQHRELTREEAEAEDPGWE